MPHNDGIQGLMDDTGMVVLQIDEDRFTERDIYAPVSPTWKYYTDNALPS